MIDLHCHILPNIDDGADSIETSLAMAKEAVRQGITHILCTPHHNNGRYQNSKATVIAAVASLQAELDKKQIELTLLEGQEVHLTGNLLEEVKQDRILFTDLADTYVLLELPTMDIPAYTEELCFSLRTHGKVPVIVHPERNAKFREDPNRLLPYLEMGCLGQLTAPSLVGSFGKSIQKTAKEMVEHNLVQMMASDAHGVNKRAFRLKEAYELLDRNKAQLMKQVAKDLVNGDQVSFPKYKEVKKKRFGLF
ncbi:exopolysaccharide biosynthesis protein [Tetragenococcus halophilus]|uniref:tyrosine-protein phosphatase n=1 Tax=Tetragenococcus halophilus TaxID=51669 RepID=UPI0019268EF0|nr:CpsB/CapC family capsule biosynthesis tyrosine phosphatase [Tetragenococcus halophilus]GEQ37753.1 exopolysaccharide biosynthesis protein [Tetragenococcus halophilus]GEQ40048.1 exopolysaccharide biosynthesis protein [Tetragenococcus halophilus]GEQ42130.1 exopolysaccharide biosynthesis protein [Tetragenococcus halophilus]GEQ44463.1 exopolysaccharide biosynthesis protein [Tetragenococcus halophilus]GEQ46813.1 exopolysaccharide biosynthesis protein [Tetragenococcus halophilus]